MSDETAENESSGTRRRRRGRRGSRGRRPADSDQDAQTPDEESMMGNPEEQVPPSDPYDAGRPVPPELLFRPVPRKAPPIERDVEIKIDPNALREAANGGARTPARRDGDDEGGGRRRRRRGGRRRRKSGDEESDNGESVVEATEMDVDTPTDPPVEPARPETPTEPEAEPEPPDPEPERPGPWDGFGPPPDGWEQEQERLYQEAHAAWVQRCLDREAEKARAAEEAAAAVAAAAEAEQAARRKAEERAAEEAAAAERDADDEVQDDDFESESDETDAEVNDAPVPPPSSGQPGLDRWMGGPYASATAKHAERRESFTGSTGAEKPVLSVPLGDDAFEETVGYPGEFPFTRGVQATMYRGRLWTMRQYAGFTSAEETNRRFRYLLEQGQTGLSMAFDLPTQIGYDSDDDRAEGEVGKVGVPINSLADMETVLDGIPLDQVTVSMTINSTAPILVAMVAAVAKRRGIPLEKVGGTVQNDLLKEYASRNTWRFPVDASLDLTTDLMRFCVDEMPRWNPISVSGYHMREAGCTAAQEIAFTLGHGLAYLQRAVDAGIPVDRIAPRVSFFFAAQMDLFEEVAKFRAARRLWARLVRERFGGDDRSCRLRFHTQTAGVALTSQQPDVNVVRVAYQALAAVLGGTQSLHTNSRDEALGLPTEESVLLALRTQQVLAEETGVGDVVDPLGGAPFLEAETDRLEEEALALLQRIDDQGGSIEAVRKGWTQAQIADAAYRHQKAVESGDRTVVGVNKHVEEEEAGAPTFRVDPSVQERIVSDLAKRRSERDTKKVDETLFGLELAVGWNAKPGAVMPAILRCVEAEATIGEICRSLEKVYGSYNPDAP
ncbi:MAG: acyl-CoA mutase large subunit family protein [Planctomycetota bacterium]|jgi:methylmalonyl-CoA mutase N-terminal domain/subunit